MADIAVEAAGLFKKFRKGEKHDSLRDLVPALARHAITHELKSQEFWALRDVNFQIEKGEAFGIIGNNGAGKSTLLKLMCGILVPTEGRLSIAGRFSALIEVGAGFHPDLTGRENIYLNGTILGMTRAEIRSKFDAIVAFSELEDFLDTPVKRYSSGMYARLGFSVAAHVEPDVLIVDEALSVGDWLFQAKSMDRLRQVARSGATVIFVSHNLRAVGELCKRIMLLERGSVVSIGSPQDVIKTYFSRAEAHPALSEQKDVFVSRVKILDGSDKESIQFTNHAEMSVEIEMTARRAVHGVAVLIQLLNEDLLDVFNTDNRRLGEDSISLEAGEKFVVRFNLRLHLVPGVYHVSAYLHCYETDRQFDHLPRATTFFINSPSDTRGVADLEPRIVRREKIVSRDE
jgi:lipopolysaccharide transport system ATP-binding protein